MHKTPDAPLGTSAIWTTVVCFVLGTGIGTVVTWGAARPIVGEGSLGVPAAVISGLIAASAFVFSTLLHRRGETEPMPRWQTVVSDLAAIALTIAFAGVTALGVLLVGEVLGVGLQGIELRGLGAGIFIGVASAVGGRFAFGAGVGLRTGDLAQLLLVYLVIGTLFAMLTAADPLWWEQHFSALGVGAGSWAFNGTLIVAGLIVGTVGAYIGRDLHRLRGDAAIGRIAWVVVLWASTGFALAGVGLIPVDRAQLPHNLAAFSTIGLFVLAGILTVVAMPRPPRSIIITSIGILLLIAVAFVLGENYGFYSVMVLEVIVVGLGLVWMMSLVRALEQRAPVDSRPSERESLLHE